jgi:hypothetical protein
MIELELTDATGTATLQMLEVPLSIKTIEGATDVQTLDYNVYTDFLAQKRVWSHTWAYMDESDYNILKGYYDRQFTLFEYPELSIDYYNVANVPVRMTLNQQEVINFCGRVQNVEVTFRETRQLGS